MASTLLCFLSVLLVSGVALGYTPQLSAIKPVDDAAREAFNEVKNEVAMKFNVDAAALVPEEYTKHTGAGTMFFIRIRVTAWRVDNYIHAKVLRSVRGAFTLTGTEHSDAHSKLKYF